MGQGSLGNDGVVRAQEERWAPADVLVTVAVAAPNRSERARFVVEKLAELGVDRLIWLDTSRGEGRPPPPAKAKGWAVAALEQSQGAFLMEVAGPTQPGALGGRLFAAVPGGGLLPVLTANATLIVGPEGGWGGERSAPKPQRSSLPRLRWNAPAGSGLASEQLRVVCRLGPSRQVHRLPVKANMHWTRKRELANRR